jgi:hypothetical protein
MRHGIWGDARPKKVLLPPDHYGLANESRPVLLLDCCHRLQSPPEVLMDLAVDSFDHTVSLRCPRHRKALTVLEEGGELEEDSGAEC